MSFLPWLDQKNSASQIKINLIPEDPFFDTALGKTLRWALSVGRYIVIFTELVVILSFVARFSLDRKVTDLNGSINAKTTTIQSYGTLEQDVRLVQTKIDQYQQIEQQTNISEVFPSLTQIMPASVQLSELIIKPSEVILSGRALSQNTLNLLINNIQLSPDFINVSVDRIETGNQEEPGFNFLISADTREGVNLTNQEQ